MVTSTLIRDEALARGSLGPAALAMMQRVVREQRNQFPDLGDVDSVDDLVNSFFLCKGAGFANTIVALPDDRAATQETRKWVKRWLVDRARERPWGALRNRIEKRLQRSALFAPSAVAHHWYLSGEQDIDRLVTTVDLFDIAGNTTVEVAAATGESPVRLGRTGQLEEMFRRLLLAAGRMHVSDLTRICANRFPSLLETNDALDATLDVDWAVIDDTVAGHDTEAIADAARLCEEQAAQLLSRLTAQERTAIRFVDDPAALASALQIGRSSAYSVIQKLRARLTELAGDTERARPVLAALIALVLDDLPAVPSLAGMSTEASDGI
ncbi:hypothetical protein [Mycobacteroides franklinii]|uniref:Uncharacterized protein n=1 Tax=Mycobacteroides franklinii TaxID=948102 RepID=A0A4R8QXU3_9MYCO|nr:hypothetical protein [Mycobacteroides franklinii]TDZ45195.1 hypothetical protein CCUG64054_00838 [Mycobacteroides franklinii]TDZ48686.1 hypothetical protein CCUG63697_03215 [Mycobacteroides franklinii]TDZ58867.1 hypothetical protein CCUG63696_00842 [Mycobacteroides franklinii]TDZ66381.1 hypothetical protein CCUG63695_00204 [Mycobacteroides franklinii]TDZ72304.1 hypothetical protein CCUG64056_00838 [Mycobacteroides franklinii]